MKIKFARTPCITGFVVGRWGVAIATLPFQPRRLILWIPGRLPIIHPPLPALCVGGPRSYFS